jgi:hypothetical protein
MDHYWVHKDGLTAYHRIASVCNTKSLTAFRMQHQVTPSLSYAAPSHSPSVICRQSTGLPLTILRAGPLMDHYWVHKDGLTASSTLCGPLASTRKFAPISSADLGVAATSVLSSASPQKHAGRVSK